MHLNDIDIHIDIDDRHRFVSSVFFSTRLLACQIVTSNRIMAISRKQRPGISIRSKPEAATPSLTNTMASSRKRRSWSCIRWKELIFISIFIAGLLSSTTMFRLATLSEWDADHQYLSIDPPPRPSLGTLAYRQSYGFFNDISDRNWRLIQQRAQRAHTLVEQEPQSTLGNNRDSPSTWYPNDLEVSS